MSFIILFSSDNSFTSRVNGVSWLEKVNSKLGTE